MGKRQDEVCEMMNNRALCNYFIRFRFLFNNMRMFHFMIKIQYRVSVVNKFAFRRCFRHAVVE